jgi:type I restriction enzyme, S subunit
MVKVNSQNYISWGEEKIGNLCQLINGRAFKSSEWTDTGLPIVRIQNLNDETKAFNYYDGFVDKKHKVYNGDILLSWSGTPGTSFGVHLWNRGDAVLNQHIFKVYLDESRCTKKFFVYAVNLRLKELIRQAHGGVGLRHITKSKLQNITIPLPFPKDVIRSLDIQHHIVSHIESLLDELKGDHQLLDKIRRDTSRFLEMKLEEIFENLPSARQPLMDVIESPPRNGWSPKCDNNPNGTPVLKLGAVLRFQYNPDEFKRTSLPTDPNAHYWLKPGDVLISRSNTLELVGHAAIYSGTPFPCIYPDLMMRIRVDQSKADRRFLVYWLQSKEVRHFIQSRASGASPTMKKINQGHVCNISFPVISVEEQRQLAHYLDSIQSEVNEMLKTMQQDAKLLERLEQAILEKAFQGQL